MFQIIQFIGAFYLTASFLVWYRDVLLKEGGYEIEDDYHPWDGC